MYKTMIVTIMSIALLFGAASQTVAAEEGNSRKGKYTYRKIYKSCFEKGMTDSARPPISPDAKTQAQWKRVFDKKKFEDFGCAEQWAALDENQLLNIYTYLHDHAADSPSPAKCK